MFFTNFTCSRCGATVTKTTRVCPKCHANLAGIKCKNCGFMGIEADFVNDRCPKCRSTVTTSSTAAVKYCPKCRKKWDEWFCDKCGHTNWVMVVMFIIWMLIATTFAVAAILSLLKVIPESENVWCVLLPSALGAGYFWFRLINIWSRRRKYKKTR